MCSIPASRNKLSNRARSFAPVQVICTGSSFGQAWHARCLYAHEAQRRVRQPSSERLLQ